MADPIFFANVIMAIQKSALDRNEKHILSALCGLVDWSTWSKQVPIRYVAIRASVSNDTVHRTIGALVTKGLIAYSAVDGGAPDWVINAQAIIDLETCSLKAAPAKKQIAGGETQDAAGEPQNAASSNLPQSAADPQQSAAPKTQSAAGTAQIAAASPILLSDPPTQSISSNPVRTPMSPSGSNVVGLFADTQKPLKRGKAATVPPPLPERVAKRDDAVMWSQIWPSLTKTEQSRIWEAVELWDKFTDVFQRVKVATLADVRAMLQIRSTGLYTLDDLHEAVQGIFVIASEKRGQWVYSSGAYLPRKLFAAGGKLEDGRQIWAKVNGDRHSKVDDLGRMQHGFTMSEDDFFYGPGGKR